MESVIFVLAIVFVGYVIFWSFKYDGAKSISEQRGLLRMPDPEEKSKEPSPKKR